MPEVIEVFLTAQFLNKMLKNKTLVDFMVLGGRYTRHPLKGLQLIKNNLPLTIKKVDSKGKFMWFEVSNEEAREFYILNRFGLEGAWSTEKRKHSNIQLTIEDKQNKAFNLYFEDSRNFGTIAISDKRDDLENELENIGPDFLKENFNEEQFHERIGNYLLNYKGEIIKSRGEKRIIKVLMDQDSFFGLGSGLGNYLAVEILYKAKISPYTKLIDIYKNRKLSSILVKSIKYILKLALLTSNVGYLEDLDVGFKKWIEKFRQKIEENPELTNIHPDINLKKGERFKFKVYRKNVDPYQNKVIADKIIPGRTTYWVKEIQK